MRQETGRVVECYPDVFAVVNGQKYLVGHPCDWCVSIGKPDAEGNLEPIPLEGELMDEVFSTLQTMLEEDDVHLFRTPVTLTLQGEFLEDGYEGDEEDDLGEDDYDDEDEDENDGLQFDIIEEGDGQDPGDFEEEELEPTDIDADNVELIASFWHEGAEYSLVRHLDPILLVAKPSQEGDGRYALVSEAEAADVNPVLERLLEKEFS
ncbi:hypothetical protein JKP88DRAFT_265038 [Tribonema minus]|uniref:DUF3727 domain-containing protein n=1 Tax=Tribonema minus TaxID=303371 RepID=A0A835YQ15_9STRA|nr:hypothetical protein JKP88DRAFT_265038 [Tribonema minus]